MRLRDRRIVVTGGPTREWIDPVRYISNASSGRMGIALADAAFVRAPDTVFIHGPMEAAMLSGREYAMIGVESTGDMLAAVRESLRENAVLIMAAAPADYTPAERSDRKIKKDSDDMVLKLKKTPDILKTLDGLVKSGDLAAFVPVGFAAETHDVENYARMKLREKGLHMICLNDVTRAGAGFGVDTNIITIFKKDGARLDLPLMKKDIAANRILDVIEEMLSGCS